MGLTATIGRFSEAAMKRREFMTLVGMTAASWPFAALAQQQIKRIGVLMTFAADDSEGQARIAGFTQGLQEAGWIISRNVQIDYRWAAAETDRLRRYAVELVALAPDVILAATSPSVAAARQATRTIPIVFVQVIDPVNGGFVDTLSHPGGNATGFTVFEYGMSGKWLELLKEIAPDVTRTAVIRNRSASQYGQLGAIQSAAQSLRMELRPIDADDAREIEDAVTAFARSPNGGLIILSGSQSLAHRELIVALAAKNRLPAVYSDRIFVAGGGLIAYDPDRIDQYRRAAGYVDRIFKGEKPEDLPVQAPTKYELVINLKAAKALGLTVPPTLLARADEVIE
jgi:putative tryptophan/tyrosine transport system substrate-binding protein